MAGQNIIQLCSTEGESPIHVYNAKTKVYAMAKSHGGWICCIASWLKALEYMEDLILDIRKRNLLIPKCLT